MAQVTLQYVNELCWVPSQQPCHYSPSAPKMTIIEPRLKIAALQQKVDCLEKTVINLEHTLTEKEEYIRSMKTFQNDQNTITISCDESSRDEAMRKLTCDIIEFNAQLQQRDQFIARQQDTIDFLQGSIEVEHAELQSMKLLKEKADEEIKMLKSKQEMRSRLNATCRTIFTELKERFDDYCKQTSAQIESAEMLKASNTQLSELVAEQQQKCLAAQDDAAELQKLLQKQEIDIKLLSSELIKIEEENLLLEKKNTVQNDKIQELQRTVDLNNTKSLENQLEYDKREKEYLGKIEDLQSAIKSTEEKCAQLTLEKDLINNELSKEKRLNEMYCLRMEELKSIISKKLSEKRQQDEETEEMKIIIRDLKSEQKSFEKQIVKYKEEQSRFLLKDSSWTHKIKQGQTEVEKLTSILNGLRCDVDYSKKFLENERIHYCETNKRLKTAYSLLGTIRCQISEKENIISNLQDSLSLANTKACQQKQKVKELEQSVENYEEEITNLKNVLTKTLTEQADSEEESCKRTEEIKRLHLEMSCLKRDKENKIKEHLRARNNLETELVRVRCDLQNAIEDLKKLKQSKFQQIFARSEHEEEIALLKHLITERQYQLDQKEKEIMAINCYNKELHEVVEDKNTQLTDLSNAAETLQQELSRTTKELALLSNRNQQLESSNHNQKLEVIRLQKLVCDFQLNKASKEVVDQQAETQKSLEAQRKMTYTLIHQLNSAQSKISTLTMEKCNLEKLIGELRSLNDCLSEEVQQFKDRKSFYYNDEAGLDDCVVYEKYTEQHIQGEDCPVDTRTKMFDLSKEEYRFSSTNKRINKDLTVGRFGQTYYLEEQKKRLPSQTRSYKRF
ncbi:COP1-interactive protein 1 isoform X2 [Nilaparvata lugens]|uniref:COP1-interactive protein 1 isoform X2 n=1 Tax=Nilaparvata lugens TaxID=108931 RepID=UPI00193D25B9|nr:COP1-interactive protein 1 isoform X2 [Nilaparvata lugens]